MSVQDAGNNSADNVLDFFERFIRSKEESRGPIPDLKIDKILGFSESETNRIFDALLMIYPVGHWAVERSNFQNAIEAAMQLLSAGLCRIVNNDREDFNPIDCCARIVNAPTLSPYIPKTEHSYLVIPTGFISALEKFISTTYAMATVAAYQLDPDKRTSLWNQDLFLNSIAGLADSNIFAFTNGVMEASSESSIQQVLETFSDPLSFTAFDRTIQMKLIKEMRITYSWEKLGYNNLHDALDRHREIKNYATKIARISVCFAISHEFGHVFTRSVDEEGSRELASDEVFTDSLGSLILYRLVEANVVPTILGSKVDQMDLGQALAGFHAWNLSKELGGLLQEREAIDTEGALGRIHEVAVRWEQAMRLIRKVWTDNIPAFAHSGEEAKTGVEIINQWGVMVAGMLRVVLLKNGQNTDIETACKILPLLVNRNSKIYNYLG